MAAATTRALNERLALTSRPIMPVRGLWPAPRLFKRASARLSSAIVSFARRQYLQPMKTLRSILLAALAAVVLAALPVVAHADESPPGDIPDNQQFVTYRTSSYSLKVPEGWPRAVKSGRVKFSDKYNSVTVWVSALARRPSITSVTRSELPKLRATVKGFSGPKVTTVQRSAGPAILITYRARSAPNAVTGKSIVNDVEQYEFWRRGKLATLVLAGPKGADNVDPWKLVTDSFAWKR